MDAAKLEAKWPPDRRSTIEASEFGIYKEQSDGKRLRGTDRATGCLLVLSLIAAAAVVLYFSFYDYTIHTTQGASTGPIVSYAKYVKEKNTMTTQTANCSTDGLLAAVLGIQNAENYTIHAPTDDVVIAKRIDDDKLGTGRQMRFYPQLTPKRPTYLSYDSNYWRTNSNKNNKLEYAEGIYGFNRRSDDFPQLAAYRAPFPPKSILDVMKYVTGSPHKANIPEYMIAQESSPQYYPIRPVEEVNRFLPDVNTPSTNSRRFRNKFGPPVYLTPPISSLPDDFMKPPNPDARYSMDFESNVPLDLTLQEGSARIPSHTDVIFRPPSFNNGYPVPDTPKPKKVKNKRNKKPISVMLDIYPLSDSEHENVQAEEDEEEHSSEIITSSKNNLQHSDAEKLLFHLNLFPKFSEGGRRISKNVKYEEQNDHKPIIHLTTYKPLQDKEENDKTEKLFEYEYSSESKNIASISKTQ